MQTLILSRNALSGPIPSSVTSLAELQDVILSYNLLDLDATDPSVLSFLDTKAATSFETRIMDSLNWPDAENFPLSPYIYGIQGSPSTESTDQGQRCLEHGAQLQ